MWLPLSRLPGTRPGHDKHNQASYSVPTEKLDYRLASHCGVNGTPCLGQGEGCSYKRKEGFRLSESVASISGLFCAAVDCSRSPMTSAWRKAWISSVFRKSFFSDFG